jgi:peptide-methionine (S)-S-oxide reductase
MKTLTTLALAFAFSLLGATAASAQTEKVVLAGGCFWGMQAVFSDLKGVTNTVVGYSGGNAMTAHYEIVSTGATGHAESVEITYDPAKISFKQLLDVYFLVAHDPTELDRQGPDEGSQYRSEIYYTTPAQRTEAQAYIAELGFYAAEAYHQNFVKNNPDNGYVVYNDLPKLEALKQKYPQLVKT